MLEHDRFCCTDHRPCFFNHIRIIMSWSSRKSTKHGKAAGGKFMSISSEASIMKLNLYLFV